MPTAPTTPHSPQTPETPTPTQTRRARVSDLQKERKKKHKKPHIDTAPNAPLPPPHIKAMPQSPGCAPISSVRVHSCSAAIRTPWLLLCRPPCAVSAPRLSAVANTPEVAPQSTAASSAQLSAERGVGFHQSSAAGSAAHPVRDQRHVTPPPAHFRHAANNAEGPFGQVL